LAERLKPGCSIVNRLKRIEAREISDKCWLENIWTLIVFGRPPVSRSKRALETCNRLNSSFHHD
jgi:hypothetical protein